MATLTGKKVQDTYKDLLQVSNSNSGVDATMRAVEDGEGTATLLYLSTAGVAVNTGLNIGAATAVTGGKVTQTAALSAATGDEIAYSLAYTTNKASSGNDYGLKIVQTDTASPGTSYLIDALVSSSSKFYVLNNGLSVHTASLTSTSADETALKIAYTTNKASGTNNDTGLEIVQTDTASPGTSYLVNALVASTSKFSVKNDGTVAASVLDAPTIQAAPKTTDAASQAVTIMGGDAFAGAATNVTGGALNLSGGIGKRIYTIVDYTALAGKTVTVTVNGSSTVLTEGAEWTAATGNNETATSLAAAVHALSGVTASASTADVRVVPDPTTYSLKLATNGAAALTITTGADGTTTVNSLLTAATGDETAFKIAYEENKAAGNGTGLEIVQTDTLSGGTSYLINAKVATAKKFALDSDAFLYLNGTQYFKSARLFTSAFSEANLFSRSSDANNPAIHLSSSATPSVDFAQAALGVRWSASNNAENGLDTGITRAGVAALKITDASTGYGGLVLDANTQQWADTVTLTDGSSTAVVDIALADKTMVGGKLIYTLTAIDGSDNVQAASGSVTFSAVRTGTTYDADIAEDVTPVFSETAGGGSLADTWAIAAAAGVVTISVTADSNLTTPTVTCRYQLFLNSPQAITKKT